MTDAHAKAIRETKASVPILRTGTVITNFADPMTATYVTVDNDPYLTPVRALSGVALSAGTRVLLISYPPRGLVITQVLTPPAHVGETWNFILTGGNVGFYQSAVPLGARAIRFLLQGGGGGSGGTAATAAPTAGNVGTATASGGGAGGDMIEVTVPLDGIQWPRPGLPLLAGDFSYTVGGGGSAAAAGNNIGGTGGISQLVFTRYNTTVTLNAAGGAGGNGGGATANPFQVRGGNFSGQISGISATGAIVYPGQPGMDGIIFVALPTGATPAAGTALMGWGGDGGWSAMSGRQLSNNGGTRDMRNASIPSNGHRYGGGAAGGYAISGQVATAGSVGGAGVIAWQPIY